MKKKIIALLTGCVMLCNILAGCGNRQEDPADKDNGKQEESEEADSQTQGEWSWPLKETKELSVWLVWSDDFVESIDDLKAIEQIEKNTNVHVNWTAVHKDEAAEKFSLMIASGKYPDIIVDAGSYYSGGIAAMCDDGVSLDLTDSIEKYMPAYWSLINSDENIRKDVVTDDGRFVGVYTLASHNGELQGERAYGGTVCRRDWLDEMGLDIPETIDDWHEALTAVKEKYPDAIPLMLPADGIDAYNTFLLPSAYYRSFIRRTAS